MCEWTRSWVEAILSKIGDIVSCYGIFSYKENKCIFTSSILNKLETIKIKNDNDEIQIINHKIDYLANEIQKIYKYLKTEQDKKYKINSTNSLKTIESSNGDN